MLAANGVACFVAVAAGEGVDSGATVASAYSVVGATIAWGWGLLGPRVGGSPPAWAARLPARPQERAAASAQAQAASAALAQQRWRVEQAAQAAPADAQVAETFYRVGEWVGAGQPVLALLPPTQIKARFFVPETDVATLKAGDVVQLSCDGCGTPIAARVSRIATQAEYTPPVIYSNAQRAKLVFMVEARPDAADAPRLKPGLPLDVRRAAAGG